MRLSERMEWSLCPANFDTEDLYRASRRAASELLRLHYVELKELNKLAMRSPSQGARLRPFHSSSRLSCGRRAVEANHHNSKAKAMVIMMAMTT